MSSHRFLTGCAIAVSFLILGACIASFWRIHEERRKLNDPAFLQSQLETIGANQGDRKGSARPPAYVRVETAKAGELTPIRDYEAKLLEVQKTTLSSEVTGVVLEMPVEVGTKVKANETLIARIDDTWTKFTNESAAKEIELSNTRLEFERKELERLTPLTQSGAISQRELLQQVNKVDQLLTSLEQAKIVQRESGEKLRRTTILAPFDGYVISKTTEIGALLTPGAPIVQIISSGELDAVACVGESIIDNLKPGDPISVFITPLGTEVKGTVHSIVPYVSQVGPRNFPVHIRLFDNDGQLKVGMSAKAFVPTAAPKPGIIIPRDAVLDKANGQTVWVVVESSIDQGKTVKIIAQPVPVRVLATNCQPENHRIKHNVNAKA